jgi:N-acetylmuramoyl-L-alanine amidase
MSQDVESARLKTSLIRQLFTIVAVGGFVATLFTAWTPVGLKASSLPETLGAAELQNELLPPADATIPTATPRPLPKIGIVAGHWGSDPGAVCADDLSEQEINLTIASLVRDQLIFAGFDVDLLQEFDTRLQGYRALALVSIHADSCEYINDLATGFKVAGAISSTQPESASRLSACIKARYADSTGLAFHGGSITADMTSYHAFDEIHHETTAVILETGFMNLDRQILTQSPETVADGITRGVLCFIYNEDATGN